MKRRTCSLRMTATMLLLQVMICCVFASASAADIITPFGADSAEGKIAAALSDQLGIPLTQITEETDGEAANQMLGNPEIFLLDTQAAPIAGLQGYTDEDLRTAMAPVCLVAESPLYIVMDAAKAEEYGIRDAETLVSWITDHEYELTFARHTGADVIDRAVTLLGNETAVLTDYFMPEEIPEVLHSGEADGAVMTGAELAENADDLLILCCLSGTRSVSFPEIPCAAEAGLPECRGETLWLFTSVKTDPLLIEQVAQVVSDADLPLPAGFEKRVLTGDELREDLKALFADLKDYMTSEGLFFYEE